MNNYSIYINNILQPSIQSKSRSEAVNMANDLYKCAGIHLSKVENWRTL